MKFRNYILSLGFISLIGFAFNERLESEPIENLAVHSGIGYDIEETAKGIYTYVIPVSVYIFNEDGSVSSTVLTGKGNTLPATREARARKLNKRFIVGFEKVYIISEAAARFGIRGLIDILFKSQWVNDNGYALVCSGKAEDLMKMKVEGFASVADYLDGMIYSSKSHDFFTKEYSLISIVQTIDAEGKKTALPYIEIKEDQLVITGMAIFKKDKMVMKMDIPDMRIMNMLRNDNVNGIIDLQKNSKEYVGFETNVKRKAECHKEDNKFKFIIDLTLNGNVINNQLYPMMSKSITEQKKFEEALAKVMKTKCEDFIDKMKNEYKMDIINLSDIAIAKYGRGTSIDWDSAISKAEITVNVKVKVDQHLRGEY